MLLPKPLEIQSPLRYNFLYYATNIATDRAFKTWISDRPVEDPITRTYRECKNTLASLKYAHTMLPVGNAWIIQFFSTVDVGVHCSVYGLPSFPQRGIQTGARFTNEFSIVIQIRWKIVYVAIHFPTVIPLQRFALATAAQL